VQSAGSSTNPLTDLVATATGRMHRPDPVRPVSGGPAGNARLTSWTGLILLGLLAVEGVTILSVHRLIAWHIVVGALLVPPVLLKTATTGWRILRYYTRDAGYVDAGPPPLLLRLMGPLVILSTLAVLGTGLVAILPGVADRWPVIPLHKLSFIGWFAVMAVHVLARVVPALRTVSGSAGRAVPGAAARGITIVVALGAGAVFSGIVLAASTAWTSR